MKKAVLVVAIIALLGTMLFAIVPMWRDTAGIELHGSILVATILMVGFCVVVGGGLMFLVFYSSRKGIDEDAYDNVAHDNTAKDDTYDKYDL